MEEKTIQYSLKLSSSTENPTYSRVFESKFKAFFDHKPNQIPSLGIQIQPHLQAVGFMEGMPYAFHSCYNGHGQLTWCVWHTVVQVHRCQVHEHSTEYLLHHPRVVLHLRTL